jgi:hypothetical protein
MANGKTVWQMLCEWWSPPAPPSPPEDEVRNPMHVRVQKSSVVVDTMQLRKYTFIVEAIKEYGVDYGSKKFKFTDYDCRSALQEGDPVEIKIRYYPSEISGREHQILVLQKHDVVDYDEGFKSLLEENQFNTTEDDVIEASFWRINDTKTPYQVRTYEVEDLAQGKEVTVVKSDAKETWYWDYWRDTVDGGGSSYKEFLFVEWDKGDTGQFTIWRGEEQPQSRVNIM